MRNRYRSGRIQEGKVAKRFRKIGWSNIKRTAGSRGAADFQARTPSGHKAYVQVKSGTARITRKDVSRLRFLAKKRRGVAVTVERRAGKSKVRFWGRWG